MQKVYLATSRFARPGLKEKKVKEVKTRIQPDSDLGVELHRILGDINIYSIHKNDETELLGLYSSKDLRKKEKGNLEINKLEPIPGQYESRLKNYVLENIERAHIKEVYEIHGTSPIELLTGGKIIIKN